MKNTTKYFGLIAALLALAAPVFGAQIGEDSLTIGKKGSVANKTIKMGNGRVVWNQSSSKLTFSNDAGSSFKNFGSGGGGGSGINLLSDFNFDFEGGTANWTASGGSFTAATVGANLIFDVQSGVFNSTASGQTLSSQSIVVPQGFKNANGAAGCYFKTAASDYKLQVFDGTNVIAERVIPVISGAPQKISTTFIFPASGSVRLRVISQSDAADLAIDNCFLGENPSVQLSQATYVGSIDITNCTGSFGWSTGPFADAAGASSCSYTATGALSAPSAPTIPGFSAALPAGEYFVTVSDEFSLAATTEIALRITNGTIASRELTTYHINSNAAGAGFGSSPFSFNVPNALGAMDYKLQAAVLAGTSFNANATSGDHMVFSVYRYPTKIQEAMTFDTVAMSWSGYHSQNCTWSNSSTGAFGDMSAVDSSCTFVESSNRNFGTVKSLDDGTPGNNYPGIVFSAPRVGTYKVCAKVFNDPSPESTVYVYSRIIDGSGYVVTETSRRVGASTNIEMPEMCGLYPVTSVGSKTLKIQAGASVGGAQIIAGDGVQRGSIEWSIFAIDQQIPAPVIVGGVISPSVGTTAIASANLNYDGASTVTIASQTGSWLSNPVRNGVGSYSFDIAAGAFASAASTSCSIMNMSGNGFFVRGESLTTTPGKLTVYTSATPAGSLADSSWSGTGLSVICVGPK